MSDEKFITFEEFKIWTEHLIKELSKHNTPSDETCERLERLETALFGDPEDPENLGMQTMVRETYNIFKGTKFATRAIIYIFGSIGVVVGGIYAFIKILRDLAR